MLSFLDHLTEADTPFEQRDICWYLSQPTERKLVRSIVYMDHGVTNKVHPVVQPYIKAILKWYQTRGGDKVWLPKLVEMAKCQNRADWTRYQGGVVYRGIHRSWDELKKVVYTGKVYTDDRITAFEAKGVYTSRYPVQSWSTKFEIGRRFALNPSVASMTTQRKIGIICEAKIAPKDTLFNPTISRKLTDYASENEVIRTSNEPMPIKVYVDSSRLIEELEELNSKTERIERLKKLVGEKNAAILSKTSVVKALLDR